MLVISRKVGETIQIGDAIRITLASLQSNRVRIAIEAPEEVLILRGELAGMKLETGCAPLASHLPASSLE